MIRKILNFIALKLGYIPKEFVNPYWQRLDIEVTLPDLKSGSYTFNVWVAVPPTTTYKWWYQGANLEHSSTPPNYLTTVGKTHEVTIEI